MEPDLLRKLIRDYVLSQPEGVEEVNFVWQGGEPTLAGIDFYKKVLLFQRQVNAIRPQITLTNSLQTNGVLLDPEWCRFLKENQFLVGLSIDGPPKLHDKYRIRFDGNGSFDSVYKGLENLLTYGVEFNTITCVNQTNGSYGKEVYSFLKQIGSRFLQFIPIVEPEEETVDSQALQPRGVSPLIGTKASSRSVDPYNWGQFLMSVFDQWFETDVGSVFVPFFDSVLSAVHGIGASFCAYQPYCGRSMIIERNGDIFACDHYAFPSHKIGNILHHKLNQIVNKPFQLEFGINKRRLLPDECRACPYLDLCNGECPANRIGYAAGGKDPVNYLCPGYKLFFAHTLDRFKVMSQAIKEGKTAAQGAQQWKQNNCSLGVEK